MDWLNKLDHLSSDTVIFICMMIALFIGVVINWIYQPKDKHDDTPKSKDTNS